MTPSVASEPRPEAEAAEQRPGQRQRERHVLARDGQQVGETGAAEGVGQIGRLLPVVADDEAGVERPSRADRAARPRRPASGAARWPAGWRGRPMRHPSTRSTVSSPAMWRATSQGWSAIRRSHRAPHADHLAGEAGAERVGGDPASVGLEPPVPPSHVDPHTVEVRRRVAQQRHLPGHDPRLEAAETVERPLGEPAGERARPPSSARPATGAPRRSPRPPARPPGTPAPARAPRRPRRRPWRGTGRSPLTR